MIQLTYFHVSNQISNYLVSTSINAGFWHLGIIYLKYCGIFTMCFKTTTLAIHLSTDVSVPHKMFV